MTAAPERFGEIVEASVDCLVAQSYALYGAPSLGTLVRVGGDVPVYSVVSGVVTRSADPTRQVVARGEGTASEAVVYAEHPQLNRLLRTDVTLVVVGFESNRIVHHYLPALPPRIHAFARVCSGEETQRFASSLNFVRLLLARNGPTVDDVLAAALRYLAEFSEQPREFLLLAGRTVAASLASDTARVQAVLGRLPL